MLYLTPVECIRCKYKKSLQVCSVHDEAKLLPIGTGFTSSFVLLHISYFFSSLRSKTAEVTTADGAADSTGEEDEKGLTAHKTVERGCQGKRFAAHYSDGPHVTDRPA